MDCVRSYLVSERKLVHTHTQILLEQWAKERYIELGIFPSTEHQAAWFKSVHQ